MKNSIDPYGIEALKEREEAEREKNQKMILLLEEMAKEIKSINSKLQTIEDKINR